MRIAIIAGELSGDILASGLIQSIKQIHPDAEFYGIAGPLMQQQGCHSLYPMEKLSVMGIVEVLSSYLELRSIQQKLIHEFLNHPPDVFIGVDAPDFNLGIGNSLKSKGIPTVQYVSPSVWAWRQYRIVKITQSVDLMLTLFPFEKSFYENFNIQVECVGHTLADTIPLSTDKLNARKELNLTPDIPLLAMLPGSRSAELKYLLQPFVETVLAVKKKMPKLQCVLPLAEKRHRKLVEEALGKYSDCKFIHILEGQSHKAMAASDAVLLASGTATLEALLLKKPMLVCYKMSPITYAIISRMAKVPYVSLPNLLSGEALVEEILQQSVESSTLEPLVLDLFNREKWQDRLEIFNRIHLMLRKNANATAAKVVLTFLENQKKGT